MTGLRATASLTLVFLLLLLAARPAAAQAPGAEELMRRAHLVQFYAGDDLRAKVSMRLISRDGQERIRELTMLRKDLAVVDRVYNPDPTRLVSDALAVGAAAVGGLELFVGQGVLALERMTGKRPDLEIVRAAAMSALHPDPVARDVEADLFEAVSP